ncbi:Uncharacterised protein [Streptococcus sanguinis]|uniref:Uncharacterized protein n=1 Tax=Streptococcus sanguinis TaxID=1305 RepID=A0A2X4AJ70_STRSA|nr:Uncharacterised protein [Streptococcus sanguinis]
MNDSPVMWLGILIHTLLKPIQIIVDLLSILLGCEQ